MDAEKEAVGERAALLVEDGMRVGLGTGSTVAFLLRALARRRLNLRCIATSVATQVQACQLGLHVEPFDRLDRLDIAIDGADQVASDGWLVKGGGGAHTREKVVARAADCFVVIVSNAKLVGVLRPPIPLELLSFGLAATLRALAPCELRVGAEATPDGGVLADYRGEVGDARMLAGRLSATPGVVEHGLFPPELVTTVLTP